MPKTSEKTLPKPVAVKAPAKGDHVFLVDGSSYIFRAYHALPPLNRKSDWLQVNAVLGFCNILWKLLRELPPDNLPTHHARMFVCRHSRGISPTSGQASRASATRQASN